MNAYSCLSRKIGLEESVRRAEISSFEFEILNLLVEAESVESFLPKLTNFRDNKFDNGIWISRNAKQWRDYWDSPSDEVAVLYWVPHRGHWDGMNFARKSIQFAEKPDLKK